MRHRTREEEILFQGIVGALTAERCQAERSRRDADMALRIGDWIAWCKPRSALAAPDELSRDDLITENFRLRMELLRLYRRLGDSAEIAVLD